MDITLIDGFIHNKNKLALDKLNLTNNFNKSKYIYSPSKYIDISKYPNKKFIFGPHFSTFPTTKFNNIHNNAIYIQPSEWVTNLWKDEFKYDCIPVITYAFGVDTDKFTINEDNEKTEVFVYYKMRNPQLLEQLRTYLHMRNINYTFIQYGSYNEEDYLNLLQKSKYGIWLGCHESQGFALEEALSCNVPLYVLDVKGMSDEYNCPPQYKNIKTVPTSAPYWDDRCGIKSYTMDRFNEFLSKLDKYKSRDYILENLTKDMRCDKFEELFKGD